MSRTILVSAGHGGGDPGATGPGGPSYPFTEADLALEQRELVTELLEKRGFRVLRDGSRGENLARSVSLSLLRGVDLALDLHFNSHDRPATGVECFGLRDKSALCAALAQAVAAAVGLKVRGRAGYRDPSESQHPSLTFCSRGGILLETCFMMKPDLDRYVPRKKAVAEAIARVLADSFDAPETARGSLRNDRAPQRVRRK